MYEPHDPTWLFFGFFGSMALFAVMVLRRRAGRPVPAGGVGMLTWGVAVLFLFGAFAMQGYDRWKLRTEFSQLTPARLTRVTLSRGNQTNQLHDFERISEVLSLAQSARRVRAHHSHPIEPADLILESKGLSYHYRIGRDSELSEEWWVQRVGRDGSEFEIGRVQSNQMGQLLDQLLPPKQ
jgi:hypothetical protein